MKIIYSNTYEGQLYIETSTSDTRYMGGLQLLTILERELGLCKTYLSNEERLKLFTECLKKNDLNAFYHESLQADQYRVGKELLSLRDELILSGWNSSLPNQPKRFSDLAITEKQFQLSEGFEGNVDRWVNVLYELKKYTDFEFDFELIVHDQEDFINPLLQAIFQKLNAVYESNKLKVNETSSNLSIFKEILTQSFYPTLSTNKNENVFKSSAEDNSLLLLKFANKQLLVDSIASISNKEEYILLATDASDLDLSIVSFGKNAIGSEQHNSNPQLVQLFKLIIPCFSQFNIHTFISFLQLKDSPIPYELRNKLLKTIIEIPGFGNEIWNKIIDDFTNEIISKDTDLTHKQRNEIVNLFLSFDPISEDEAVIKAKNIISYLLSWSSRAVYSKQNQPLKEQFHYLYELFVKLNNLILDEKNLLAIENAFNIVYESSNFTNYQKQENSVLCINHLGNVVSECEKTAIITDFYGSINKKDVNKLLLKEEQEFLKENHIFYNFYDQLIVSNLLRGLSKINKQLILCYFEDDKTEKHPFQIRMETLFSNLDTTILQSIEVPDDLSKIKQWSLNQFPLISSKQISLPQGTDYFESKKIQHLNKREIESASSIEKFILYPFDWVLEYKLNMRAYQGIQLGRENQLKGKIAHKVIENIFSKLKNKQVSEFKISLAEFVSEFNQVVKQEGVLFLQPEKRFELGEFKSKFKKSFYNLIDILIKNELTIESCEYAFGYEDPFYLDEIESNLNGYIDLLLKNKKGDFVVFDLKWTFSEKKFKQKIENNEEIQLALYTAALKDTTNIITGYFLLNQNKLITTADLLGNYIVKIPSKYTTADVLSKIEKSVRYRWNEIKSGKLEIGDGLSPDMLAYSTQNELIQLPLKGKLKEVNPYTGFELFKGQLN
jgi:ATP-dependent helicase/nuclease subunit B